LQRSPQNTKKKGIKIFKEKTTPTIPTHHTRAVYYSTELRKEMGEMDGLGEKQTTHRKYKQITRHVLNKSKRWSKVSCTHAHTLTVTKSKKLARIET
jgi:hypothetical protein